MFCQIACLAGGFLRLEVHLTWSSCSDSPECLLLIVRGSPVPQRLPVLLRPGFEGIRHVALSVVTSARTLPVSSRQLSASLTQRRPDSLTCYTLPRCTIGGVLSDLPCCVSTWYIAEVASILRSKLVTRKAIFGHQSRVARSRRVLLKTGKTTVFMGVWPLRQHGGGRFTSAEAKRYASMENPP